jgi:hypothetical protein
MIVASPIKGTYQVHEAGQEPVEGTAVYLYRWGWSCEEHGVPTTTARFGCRHIKLAKEWRSAHE